MNAAEKAISPEATARIATVVNLFRREFPDVKANLKPWTNDEATRSQADPESIDIGFNFPPGKTLVQIRFSGDRLIGVDAICFGLFGNQRWRFSTIADWQFLGSSPPFNSFRTQFKRVCYQMFEVFNSYEQLDKAS
jgi:hypothetical protein